MRPECIRRKLATVVSAIVFNASDLLVCGYCRYRAPTVPYRFLLSCRVLHVEGKLPAPPAPAPAPLRVPCFARVHAAGSSGKWLDPSRLRGHHRAHHDPQEPELLRPRIVLVKRGAGPSGRGVEAQRPGAGNRRRGRGGECIARPSSCLFSFVCTVHVADVGDADGLV